MMMIVVPWQQPLGHSPPLLVAGLLGSGRFGVRNLFLCLEQDLLLLLLLED